ncbi:MAG: hypothetical protein EDX89_24350 [Acidobacteria bacterium]|nr:MAG: hypothetical protein EDX89_24350 [Acidobacteriota bacterium]MCE7958692.1 hypothetical protein [Acidobacteria bacterium ACB2]
MRFLATTPRLGPALVLCFVCARLSPADAVEYRIGTLAGPLGGSGYTDGIGSSAQLSSLSHLALDSAGRVYVSDAGNQTIRRFDPVTGELTLFAGAPGYTGSIDSPNPTGARFYFPRGLAIDGSGNLYVADSQNCTIRKVVLSTGQVSTIAGSAGQAGGVDGVGTAARFYYPEGLALDGSGNLYVADDWNNAIRRVELATGQVTTIAGALGQWGSVDGTGSAARFDSPQSLAVDGAGNLYVADRNSHAIRKVVLATGQVTTIAGALRQAGAVDGTGTAARFNGPQGLALDGSGQLFVSEMHNHDLRRVELASAAVSTVAGLPGQRGESDGVGSAARFYWPFGLVWDGASRIYVADWFNFTLRAFEIATGSVTTVAGRAGGPGTDDGPSTLARFDEPLGVSVDPALGELYVAERWNHTVRWVYPYAPWGGDTYLVTGTPGVPGSLDGDVWAAQFDEPSGVAALSWDEIYVADSGNCTIRRISGFTVETVAGLAGDCGDSDGVGTAARLSYPQAVEAGGDGLVYIADTLNDRIRSLDRWSGQVVTVAGSGLYGAQDGPGPLASFRHPSGLALDGLGNLFVSDEENHTIRKIVLSSGLVSTIAGATGQQGSSDGVGTAARFRSPRGLAVQGGNVLWVADLGNNVVRRVDLATHQVTTVGGLPRAVGSTDGLGEQARFFYPADLAIDGEGRLLIADSYNHRIRVAVPGTAGTRYYTAAPCRVLDTRNTGAPVGGPSVRAGESRLVRVGGSCEIPRTARGVTGNLTVVGASTSGFLTAWPQGFPRPLTSSVNFKAGQVRANNGLFQLGGHDALSLYGGISSGQVEVILDVTGWFE